MPPGTSKRKEPNNSRNSSGTKKDRAAEIADTFEWLITAFILAFVFRAFVMEAFRIPTGSMADTLKGAHFRLRCRQCGYRYDHGFMSDEYEDGQGRSLPEDAIPSVSVNPPGTRCPSCGNYSTTQEKVPVSNGDRILVLKCIYQFFEPKQWDVIVFKNPLGPRINYIKRLVGLPGDKLEIIDGDIYIDGQISRKPPKVQKELWTPIYDNDYQPIEPEKTSFNGHEWRSPFVTSDSGWEISKTNPTLFQLYSPADQIKTMTYNTLMGNNFQANYAYGKIAYYKHRPYCSDLMVRFYAKWGEEPGVAGVSLSKYGIEYRAWIDLTAKEAVIARVSVGEERLAKDTLGKEVEFATEGVPIAIQFANVDHQLIFKFGRSRLTYELGREPDDAGQIRPEIEPQAQIFGSGKLTLSHAAIFRDIHYTSTDRPNWASQGHPYLLGQDEFFVLGDNSPNSQDSRLWAQPGMANRGSSFYPEGYRPGIVPRDYLVGKALFVYWPSGFKPFAKFPIAAIPNVGQMRFIYGGSNEIE